MNNSTLNLIMVEIKLLKVIVVLKYYKYGESIISSIWLL